MVENGVREEVADLKKRIWRERENIAFVEDWIESDKEQIVYAKKDIAHCEKKLEYYKGTGREEQQRKFLGYAKSGLETWKKLLPIHTEALKDNEEELKALELELKELTGR